MTTAEQIKDLSEKKAAKLKELDEMIDKSEKENRNFTSDEKSKYDKLMAECKDLAPRIKRLEEQEARALGGAKVYSPGVGFENQEDTEEERSVQILKRVPDDKKRPISQWYLRNFDVDQRMQKADVYKVLGTLATGKSSDSATSHALGEVRSVTGTALLNPFLSAQLWDGGLSKSRLAQAGMRTMPLQTGEHKMARIVTYPTFEWKEESGSTTNRTVTFDNVTFEAKTLRGFLRVPGELAQDGMNFDKVLKQVMTKAAGNTIDTAGLIGSGSGAEPTGIIGYSGLNTYPMGGTAPTSYDPLLEVASLILQDNGEVPTHAIMSPQIWKRFAALKESTTNAPLRRPGELESWTFLETSKLWSASSVICGGFENLYMGVRFDISVMVSPVRSETFEYDYMLAFRGDFKPEREEAFGAITAII